MKGSLLYEKYPKVHTGALLNLENELEFLNSWLKDNLYIPDDYDDDNSRRKAIKTDYRNEASSSSTLTAVYRKFNVNRNNAYTVMEDNKEKEKNIKESFTMRKVFKTNEPDIDDFERGDTDRFLLVEKDLLYHPKYEEIKDTVEELKKQVCSYAQKIRGGEKILAGSEGKCHQFRSGLSRHYQSHHREWWEEHKDKKPRI